MLWWARNIVTVVLSLMTTPSKASRRAEEFHRRYLNTKPLFVNKTIWKDYIQALTRRIDSQSTLPFEPQSEIECKSIQSGEFSMPVYYFRNPTKHTNISVLFLHGGAFLESISPYHCQFIDTIVQAIGVEFLLPVYPTAPRHTYKETFVLLEALYREMLHDRPPSNIFFSGDSAGAGLAASFCEELPNLSLPQPKHLVLLSPWTDGTMTNPEIPKYAPHDVLVCPQIFMAGLAWAGEPCEEIIDSVPSNSLLYDYHISPLRGDVSMLPPTTIFSGTHETLFPDAVLFAEKLLHSGVPVHFIGGENLFHDWPVNPIPEAEDAIRLICEIFIPGSTATFPKDGTPFFTKNFKMHFLRDPEDGYKDSMEAFNAITLPEELEEEK